MIQIYNNLYKDEEGKYLFADNNDTRYLVMQDSYLLAYIIELLVKLNQDNRTEVTLNNGTT